MANQLSNLLKQWHPQRDNTEWVLGTVFKTEGPCYRKPGAMMLFNDLGQQFGLLSGGCLESDIHKHAQRVMSNGKAITLCYDGSDEDDLSFQLGIGCGGTVHILLQPITAGNGYLGLEQVKEAQDRRGRGVFYQQVPDQSGAVASYFSTVNFADTTGARLFEEGEQQWLATPIVPDPHLLVVGGGLDARPLVGMAKELGWLVTVCDPRPANARREFFLDADHIVRELGTLTDFARSQRVDAAVLMAHNIALDAEGLKAVQSVDLKYLAMLGPLHRQQRVVKAAGLETAQLNTPIAGPAGLNLGGELPESIALAILAECHCQLYGRNGQPLSDVLKRQMSH